MSLAKYKIIFLTVSLILLIIIPNIYATFYIVSTRGSDANNGLLLETPFRTIQKAANVMVAGDTCYIRSGVYRETVTPLNSGTAGAPITFRPYFYEGVTISGADLLTEPWNVYSGNIYKATTTKSFIQLFCDGQMMNEARWPNVKVNQLVNMPRAICAAGTNETTLVDSHLPPGNWNGAYVFINNGPEYWSCTRQISAYMAGSQFTFASTQWTTNPVYNPKPGNHYYLFGALAGLDSASEWYLDAAAHTIYIWTPNSQTPTGRVELKQRDYAFDLKLKNYITLYGLNIFSAGVNMLNANHCVVERCREMYVEHYNRMNVLPPHSTHNCMSGSYNEVKYTTIAYSSSDGIEDKGEYNKITDCIIHDVDYLAFYAGAINVSAASHGTYEHNTLFNSGRYLILIANLIQSKVSFNNIYNFGTLTYDYGGIGGTGAANGIGTEFSYNWVHDSIQKTLDMGIYFDSNAANHIVHHNVVWNCTEGIRLNCPTEYNLVYNNTLVSPTIPISTCYFASWDYPGSWTAGGPKCTGSKIINNLSDKNQVLTYYGLTPDPFPEVHHNGIYPIDTKYIPKPGPGSAIDQGVVIPGVTDGYLGVAPDIGAYEYGADAWVPGHRAPSTEMTMIPSHILMLTPQGFSVKVIDSQYCYIYPNPTHGTQVKYRFFLANRANVNIKFYTTAFQFVWETGMKAYPAGWSEGVWDASGMANGVYLYQVRAYNDKGSETITKKVVLLKK